MGTPHRKLVFPESNSQCMDEDDFVSSTPPISRTSKSFEGKEVYPDGIPVEDSDTAMFNDEKVGRSIKGKAIILSSDEFPDHKAKGIVANDFVGSSGKNLASSSDDIYHPDLFLDNVIDVDEYARMLAYFDNVDIPPGVEAPMPPFPWLFDPQSDIKSVSGSSSDTNYQAARSFSSGSHNVIGLSGHSSETSNSSNDYSGLYLEPSIDINEYAVLLAHLDDTDSHPGIEAPIPHFLSLSDHPKSNINAVPGSSSSMKAQTNVFSPASSSWMSPEASSGKVEQSYLQLQGSASNNSVGLSGHSSETSNSSNDYAGLYLEPSIDINEYAVLLAHLNDTDSHPGIEAPIPHFLSLSDHPKSNINAVPGSSSSMKAQTNVFSPASSSWMSPEASSSKVEQSYLQLQGSASNNSVGVALSKSLEQTQKYDVPAKQVSSTETDESIRKNKDFKQFDTVEDHSDHYYTNTSGSTMQKNWTKRIQKEWKILEKDLPDAIFVRAYETRMDLLRAVIVGAEGTPYHDGLFFFDVFFPCDYPNVPPHVHYHSGGLRLNPNLYNCGKVCLSLLNTWSGDTNERWIPGESTVLQVLVSIQGLILNTEPYFNEPGFAPMKGKPSGEIESKKYNESTLILSLKTMVYVMKRPPKYFEEFVLVHFRNHAQDILVACKAYMDGAEVGSLVKGSVQGVNGNKSFSQVFKNSVAGFLPTLVKELRQIGAKGCKEITSINWESADW